MKRLALMLSFQLIAMSGSQLRGMEQKPFSLEDGVLKYYHFLWKRNASDQQELWKVLLLQDRIIEKDNDEFTISGSLHHHSGIALRVIKDPDQCTAECKAFVKVTTTFAAYSSSYKAFIKDILLNKSIAEIREVTIESSKISVGQLREPSSKEIEILINQNKLNKGSHGTPSNTPDSECSVL